MANKKGWNQEAAIYSALRRAYRSSPAVKDCLNAAKEVFYIQSKKGKQLRRVRFECAQCRTKSSRKGVAVDHIHPVVDPNDANKFPNGEKDWNKQIKRLIVDTKGLQILCRSCHDKKSKAENAVRRTVKKLKERTG